MPALTCRCGYDLTGLTGCPGRLRCPECGREQFSMTCRRCRREFTPAEPSGDLIVRCANCGFWQPHPEVVCPPTAKP